jgi:hypothetical protein
MYVEILNDIFEDASNADELNNLLVFFRQDRHFPLFDALSYEKSEWKKDLNTRDVKLLGKFMTASLRKDTQKKVITVSNTNVEPYFSIKAAYLYLNQPLIVLLEHSKYDAPFVNAIIRNFDNGTLTQAKQEKWWKYDMGSGSSTEPVIKGELENAFENAFFTEPKSKYLRYFVLLDSDKKYPSDKVDVVEAKKEFFTKHDIPYHVLYKREK